MGQPEDNPQKHKHRQQTDEPLHTDYPLSEHDEVEEAERRLAKMQKQHKTHEQEELRDDENKPAKDTGK
jgi:hypothetical protein